MVGPDVNAYSPHLVRSTPVPQASTANMRSGAGR